MTRDTKRAAIWEDGVATFYVYSGTGNSYRVAQWMAEDARAAGLKATLHLEVPHPENIPGDLVGIVVPTHGFTLASGALGWIRRLPPGNGRAAVAVVTRGSVRVAGIYVPGFEGSATLLLSLILARRGYHLVGVEAFDMPSNWTALHSGQHPDVVAAIEARTRARVGALMRAIVHNERRPLSWCTAVVGLMLLPLSLAYLLAGQQFLSMLFFAGCRCTGCGVCATYCPHEAIEMRAFTGGRRPCWTRRCRACMRCMAYCPEEAVEVSHLLAGCVLLMALALPTERLLRHIGGRIPWLGLLGRLPRWLLDPTLGVAILHLLHPGFQRWLQRPAINRFFTCATFTHRYRRYHEPATSVRDLVER